MSDHNEQKEHREPKHDPRHHDHKHDAKHNLQDFFLNHLRQNKTPATVFLVNGVKLQGIITRFDMFSLLLRREAHVQLVYKHAISTIMPTGAIGLFEDEGQDAALAV